MSSKRYISGIDGSVVLGIQYNGCNHDEVEEFTGLRPHDIYQIAPELYTCAITPVRDGHYQPQIALAPGMYIIKSDTGMLRTCTAVDLELWYKPLDLEEAEVSHE